MKNTCQRIVTFGVFDMFHFGHLCFFENIKKQFGQDSFLIVCVQSDENVLKYKPESKIFYHTEERVRMIKNLKCVDDVMIYDNVDVDIQQVNFDIWAKGPDQTHQGFQNAVQWCHEHGKQIYVVPRTDGISSTYIKKMVLDLKENK